MKMLKSYILISLVVVNSAMAADPVDPFAPGHSVLFPEIAKILDLANSRGVGQRVSYEISNILDEHGMQSRSSDLGYKLMVTEQVSPPGFLPDLVSAIKNDSRVQEALSKTNTDSNTFPEFSETLAANKKFNYQPPNVYGEYSDSTMNVDYISNLRHKYNLVGVHLTAPGKTIALRQVGQNIYQFVAIKTGGFGTPDVMQDISGEFTKDQLIEISSKLKSEVSKASGKVNMQPGLNLTDGAIKMFVATGSPVVAAAGSVMAVVDVITSPFQLSIWAWKKAQAKLKGHSLNKRVDVTSNDILRLTDEQMTQLRSAIYQTLPPAKMNKCVRVYRGY